MPLFVLGIAPNEFYIYMGVSFFTNRNLPGFGGAMPRACTFTSKPDRLIGKKGRAIRL